jgi:hypothetical protein
MENHPIPQDVTGFQFKLIGDMTIKQFGYVAAGCILAFVFFYFPISPFIKFPIALLFALFGLGLAFLPIEGRPFDIMVGYFIKALLNPNQYAYHKVGGTISIFHYAFSSTSHTQGQVSTPMANSQNTLLHDPNKQAKLQTYLHTLHTQHTQHTQQTPSQSPFATLSGISPLSSAVPLQPIITPSSPPPLQANLPQSSKEEDEANLSLQAATLKHELDDLHQKESVEKDAQKLLLEQQQAKAIETRLNTILEEKTRLEQELQNLRQKPASSPVSPTPTTAKTAQPEASFEQVAKDAQSALQQTQQKAQPAPMPPAPTPVAPAPTARTIPADMARSIGLPHMPEAPNLIIGIVKDSRGNVLSNILVEVKDKDGDPARAFRTNTLGQFASATPLANGTYLLEFEDPKAQHTFDTVEITAQNEIMLPLEIISHDAREELRKELFS